MHPPANPILQLRRRARRLVVAPADITGTRYVYAIAHQGSPELASAPVLDVARSMASLDEARQEAWRLRGAATEEEREAIRQELEEAKAKAAAALREDLIGTPERRGSYVERCRALVAGAIEAVGVALPDAPEGPCGPEVEPHHVCAVLEVLRPGTPQEERVYLRPLRVQLAPSTKPGEVSVHDFFDGEISQLARMFSKAFNPQASVTPLSGESRGTALG